MTNPGSRFLDIYLRNEVTDLHTVAKRLKAMRETLWNIKLPTVDLRQFERLPASVCWRPLPDVDDHIPDCSPNATHKLRFAVRLSLIMHAAQSAGAR